MKKVLLFLAGGLISVCSFAQLNGTYTVNAAQATGGTNYQTFTAAFSALTTQGVSGPVTFNCVQGTYNEQVYLSYASIAGTSTTNTITFQAASTNTNQVLWTNSSYPLYWYYCTLSNIKFKGLHFATTGSFNATIYNYFGTLTNITYEDNIIDGPATTSTSITYATVCNYYATLVNFQCIDNTIRYGSVGILGYLSNYNSNSASEMVLNGNDITDFAYMGMYLYGYYSPYSKFTIKDNMLRNSSSGYTFPYGIYCYYPKDNSEISGNDVGLNASGGGYGVAVYYGQGTSSTSGGIRVFNNVISFANAGATSNQIGLAMYYSYYTKMYHNSVRIANDYLYSAGGYLYYNYNGNEFKNNIIHAGGSNTYGMYIYPYNGTFSGYLAMSNNAYDQNNSESFKFYNAWTGTTYTSLASFQAASSTDANSVVADPLYISATNLTPQSATINNNGTPLGITTDFYGMTRSATTPDPGAIEFSVPQNNAQPTALLTPDAPLCVDDTSVITVIKNSGLVNLTSLNINYSLNSGSATVINWTGNLAPQAYDTVVVSASSSFTNGDNVVVWTSMPNGVLDSSALFDTIALDLYDGLSGTYTIPGDYATFTAAVNDLILKGVCDHVVFNVSPGTYSEQISIPQIVGTSADATITFQSSTLSANAVTLTSSAAYTAQLSGVDWLTFNELKITNNTGNVIQITGESDNCTIENCWLKGSTGSSTTTQAVIYRTGVCDYMTISNNRIEKGATSLYFNSGSTAAKNIGLTVEDNLMEDHTYYGNMLYYTDYVEFNRNIITNDSGSLYGYTYYPLYIYYCDKFNITSNYMGSDNGSGYLYALYMGNCIGYTNPRSQVANNCITAGNATGSMGYYSAMSGSGIFDIYNNTFNRFGYNNYYALQLSSGGLITIKNNNFADFDNGYALYVSGGFTVSESDYNNLYTTGSTPVYFGSAAYSSLAAYQAASGFDMNSVQTDPAYQVTMECITCNDTLNNAGTVLSTLTGDIDGNLRSLSTPDIGAHEYVTPATFTLGPDDTICGNEFIVEAGPAQSVVWSVNTIPFTTPSVTISSSSVPEDFEISVVIATEYCGSANDDVTLRLVPNAELPATEHICADETTDLEPGGGANAVYSWSNGETTSTITVDEAGLYTVTKMEEGCESSATVEVTKSDAVEILDVEPCSDDLPVSLDASINNGTSYAWDGGTSINTAVNTFNDAGSYSVTATDSYGCTSSDGFNVIVLETPEAEITQVHSGLYFSYDAINSLYLSSNTTYFWDFGNGQTATTQSAYVIYPWSNCDVTYTVTLTIDNGCGSDVATMSVTPCPLGINELSEGSFVLYPNPANESVRFTLGSAAADQGLVQVMDITGRVITSQSVDAGTSTGEISLSDLSAGSYLVRISVDGNSSVNTLIKQ